MSKLRTILREQETPAADGEDLERHLLEVRGEAVGRWRGNSEVHQVRFGVREPKLAGINSRLGMARDGLPASCCCAVRRTVTVSKGCIIDRELGDHRNSIISIERARGNCFIAVRFSRW